MSSNEILKPQETSISHAEQVPDESNMAVQEAQSMFAKRKRDLEHVQPLVSVDFYNKIVEKVKQEERQFMQFFNIADQKQKVLKKYSFVLDQQYFEQKFLNPRSIL